MTPRDRAQRIAYRRMVPVLAQQLAEARATLPAAEKPSTACRRAGCLRERAEWSAYCRACICRFVGSAFGVAA